MGLINEITYKYLTLYQNIDINQCCHSIGGLFLGFQASKAIND